MSRKLEKRLWKRRQLQSSAKGYQPKPTWEQVLTNRIVREAQLERIAEAKANKAR